MNRFTHLKPGLARRILQAQFKQQEPLTRRELEVLAHIVDGASSKLIAERLAIAKDTVDTYRSRIFPKMGAHNVADAVRIACGH